MADFFVILFLLSFLGLFLGLISPKLVIYWGETRKRRQVLLIYGLGTVLFFILIGVTAPDPKDNAVEKDGKTIAGIITDKIVAEVVLDKPKNYEVIFEQPGQNYVTLHIKAESGDRYYLTGLIQDLRKKYENDGLGGFQIFLYPSDFPGEPGEMPSEEGYFASYGCNFNNGYSNLIFKETNETIRID